MVEYILILPQDETGSLAKRVFGIPILGRLVHRLEANSPNKITIVGSINNELLIKALGDYPKQTEWDVVEALPTDFKPAPSTTTVLFWDATLFSAKDLPELLTGACEESNSPIRLEEDGKTPLGALAVPSRLFSENLCLSSSKSVEEVHEQVSAHLAAPVEAIQYESFAQHPASSGQWGPLKKQLLNELKKPVFIDGPTAAFIQRPIALLLTRLIAWSSFSPNHATATALIVGLAGAFAMTLGTQQGFVVGGSLMVAGAIIDCIDGNLARLKDQGSYRGAWFDTITDDICNTTFMVGTGIGLYRANDELWMLGLGVASAIIVIPGLLFQYKTLHGMGLADVACYPWLFDDKESPSEPTYFDLLLTYMKYLVKRDTYIMFFLGFILAGVPWLIVVFSFIGGTAFEIALILDLKKKRRLNES